MLDTRWADRLGMFVAAGCGVHCAALSLLFILYPALWMNRKYWEMGLWQKLLWLEWGLLVTAWLLVIAAMLSGWLRHRRVGPAVLATASLVLMTLVVATSLHFANQWMGLVTLAAGILLAGAHYWNLKSGSCRLPQAEGSST
ncbi:MerC domain-containing protein [Wenzhouxiangella limi]|uniref:MerC domain-containing protein n=1 Tax=Wenzhouxiangella limi TaxID=2707351 RepID=A0A845UWX2_9GAMM|nr:MerC domain-containing protein [Wenzhouxiangella limi]NDY95148.1 MerC domain-containing protein [Wenzhouxiangella limi]